MGSHYRHEATVLCIHSVAQNHSHFLFFVFVFFSSLRFAVSPLSKCGNSELAVTKLFHLDPGTPSCCLSNCETLSNIIQLFSITPDLFEVKAFREMC